MKHRTAIVGLLIGLASAAFGLRAQAQGYVDAVAAIVRDKVITVYDLQQATRHYEAQLLQRYKGSELEDRLAAVRRAAAMQIIEQELLYAEFQELSGTVPAGLLEKRIDEIIVAQTGGNRDKFGQVLREQGQSLAEFEEEMRKRLAADLLAQDRVYRQVQISPEDVDAYYREHTDEFNRPARIRLQAIELKPDGRNSGGPEKTAEVVLKKLRSGADFAQIAAQYSDHVSAEKGGDLGWIDTSQANPAFLSATAGLAAGELGEPIVLAGNTYILRLAEREAGGIRPLDSELSREIERQLGAREEQRRYRKYIKELREKYYVKTFFEEEPQTAGPEPASQASGEN